MGCENTCEPPEPANEDIDYPVTGNVIGQVLDQNGQPAVDVAVDVCGTNICQFGKTIADGTFVTDSGDNTITDVRLLYGTGKTFNKMGSRLPSCDAQSCDAPDVGTINIIRFPDYAEGVEMAPGTDASQGGVTLSIGDDACVTHDLLVYDEPAQRVLRAVVIDYEGSGLTFPAVDQANLGSGLVLVSLAPIHTVICPAAPMTFDNVAGWAPDAEVEIFLHGTQTFQHYVPYGEWAKVGEGVVSSDGANVTTAAGSEIESLGLYAIRLKP